jgi:hypothetical protein
MANKASGNSFLPSLLPTILALSVSALFQPPLAVFATEPAQASSDRTALQGHISEFYKGLLAARRSRQWTPEEDRSRVGKIEDAVTAYLLNRVNGSPRPSCTDLEYEINDAMSQGIAGMSWKELTRGNPSVPSARVLQDAGTPPTIYVAAFQSEGSNRPYNAIRAFAEREGSLQLVASAGAEFKDRTLNVIKLRSFGAKELRFLVYGIYIGSPEGLTKLTVYKFDGTKLETLWNQDSVWHAEVSFSDDQIVVYSYNEGVGPKRFGPEPWPSTRTYYAQTPEGLQVVKVEHGLVH